MARRTFRGWLLLAALTATLPGCDVWEGRPKQPAVYKLPKGKRVLVLVEVAPGVSSPPAYTTNLADRIGSLLFTNKATDDLVPQDQVLALQQKDPAEYRKFGTAQIGQRTGADIVVRVYLTYLQAQLSVDGAVVWGDAQAYVKVIASDGQKLWPAEATGTQVSAHVNEVEVAVRDVPRVLKDLSDQVAKRVGRMFYEWQAESGEPPVRAL